MSKSIRYTLLFTLTLLLSACGNQRLKFVSTSKVKSSNIDVTVENKVPDELNSDQVILNVLGENQEENESSESFVFTTAANTTIVAESPKQNIYSEYRVSGFEASSIERAPKKVSDEKSTKSGWIFRDTFHLFLISSGIMALSILSFFLGTISIYFPAVAVILCIAGFYFFFRGLSEYRWAKDKLKWQPKEYAKEQKFGWITALMIFNILLLCLGVGGILSIIF